MQCVHEMLDEALTLVKHEMVRGGVEVDKDYGDVPMVEMDSKQLQQVIVTLPSTRRRLSQIVERSPM